MPPIQLTVEPTPVSRLYIAVARGRSLVDTPPTGTTVTAVICIVVDDAGRRSLPPSTESTVIIGRPWSSLVVAERYTEVLKHLPRARSRTDRRTDERCRRGRDAASTPRRLKRCPAVA